MENVNARIQTNVARLNVPLMTLFARQHSAFRAVVANVPDDLCGVFLRIVSAAGSFTDFSAVRRRAPGEWRVSVPSFAFADAGTVAYEIHAEDECGECVALGSGVAVVCPFTSGGAAPAPGTPVAVAKMPVKGGGWVNCVAVMDETGEYTYEFEKVPAEDGE